MQEHVGCLVFVAGDRVKPARNKMLRLLEEHHLLLARELEWKKLRVSDPTGRRRERRYAKAGEEIRICVAHVDAARGRGRELRLVG